MINTLARKRTPSDPLAQAKAAAFKKIRQHLAQSPKLSALFFKKCQIVKSEAQKLLADKRVPGDFYLHHMIEGYNKIVAPERCITLGQNRCLNRDVSKAKEPTEQEKILRVIGPVLQDILIYFEEAEDVSIANAVKGAGIRADKLERHLKSPDLTSFRQFSITVRAAVSVGYHPNLPMINMAQEAFRHLVQKSDNGIGPSIKASVNNGLSDLAMRLR